MSKIAKALAPPVISIVVAVVNTIASGGFGVTWKVLLAGALSGLATYLVPNKPKTLAPPPK